MKTKFTLLICLLLLSISPLFGGVIIPLTTADNIATAVTNAASGDTIELAAGTYQQEENVVINKPLTVRAADLNDRPILIGIQFQVDGDVQGLVMLKDLKSSGLRVTTPTQTVR